MTHRIATCHCGQLELTCQGDPKKVSLCHCTDCQRRSGSAFSVAVFYDRESVTLARGSFETFERASASGFPVKFHFCPKCGSNIWWEPARMPQLVGVAIGAFADPAFPGPEQAVWARDKHHWLELPESLKSFEANPPPRGAG